MATTPHRNEEDNTKEVREEFLGFVSAESTTGQALADKFLSTLQEYGIIVNHMRAQGYDGAANMSEVHRGVQAIIKQRIPQAEYVHCKVHSLNLAIGYACEEPLVRNTLNTLQQIAFSFDYSTKRLLAFQECLGDNDAVRKEMQRKNEAMHVVRDSLGRFRAGQVFVQHLALSRRLWKIFLPMDCKARSYLYSIRQSDFIICICATEHACSGIQLPCQLCFRANT